ncbi:HisA/HisF-related TIM barrel protein [Aliarcobacter butzleri]
MRVGSTIILLNGYCYQSYNWKMMRPLGELQRVIDSLEAYHCDEISIIRPIRIDDTNESFKKDIQEIKKINCMTPLNFGGGLRSCENIDLLHDLPIERLIFSSAFINKDFEVIEYARRLFGQQAIQALIPFLIENDSIKVFSSNQDKLIPIEDIDMDLINKSANEIVLYDIQNESRSNQFKEEVIKKLDIDNEKLIISGGIGHTNIKNAKRDNLASVLIDNKVLHEEYSIRRYKNG